MTSASATYLGVPSQLVPPLPPSAHLNVLPVDMRQARCQQQRKLQRSIVMRALAAAAFVTGCLLLLVLLVAVAS
jgi:hypothetical protein